MILPLLWFLIGCKVISTAVISAADTTKERPPLSGSVKVISFFWNLFTAIVLLLAIAQISQ